MTIAIGVTCAPREQDYAARSLTSLRTAGFDQPVYAFCEPGTTELPNVEHVRHAERLGCFRNFSFGLKWLVENTDAACLMMLQDDVIWRNDAAERMRVAVSKWGTDPGIGVLSAYCGQAMVGRPVRIRKREAWHDAVFYNKAFWGALALCFPRKAAELMLTHPRWLGHTHHRKVDVLVGNVLRRELNLRVLVHAPSLSNHIGAVSTLGRHRVKGIAWGRQGFEFREQA